MEYSSTIGLEIHVQLSTKSKMFCRCDNNAENREPNTTVCPVCMGFPGTLPVANKQAIEFGMRTALALGCQPNLFQRFDRKNYFYPDLPKGYQISQFFFPVGEHGKLTIDYLAPDRKTKKEFTVGITRLHLEEDAGKLVHTKDATLADYNRCGTPLMEIVTEPDISSPEEAKAFMQELQRIVRALGVSQADMEKGNLRCDANISIRPKNQKELGAKVEVKNMNSFKFMEQALKYEIDRQIKALENGEKILQETRGWDTKTNTTVLQRSKEGSVDYRYFPEPDLPPVVLTNTEIDELKEEFAILPRIMRGKAEQFGLSYDRVCELQDRNELTEFISIMEQDRNLDVVMIANWASDPNISKLTNKIEFYRWLSQEKPTKAAILQVLDNIKKGISLSDAVNQLPKVDNSAVERTVALVIAENPDVVAKYKAGDNRVFGFLMGQIVAKLGGSGNPALVKDILTKLLTK